MTQILEVGDLLVREIDGKVEKVVVESIDDGHGAGRIRR